MTIPQNQNEASSEKIPEVPLSTLNSNLIAHNQSLITYVVNESLSALTNLFSKEKEVKKLPPHKSNILFLDIDDSSTTSEGLPYKYPGNQRTSEDSSGESTLNSE